MNFYIFVGTGARVPKNVGIHPHFTFLLIVTPAMRIKIKKLKSWSREIEVIKKRARVGMVGQ